MLNRTAKVAIAIAIAALALPAAAGSWPNIPARKSPTKTITAVNAQPAEGSSVEAGIAGSLEEYRYFPNEEKTHGKKSFAWGGAAPQRVDTAYAAGARSVNGFEYIGGEGGWQPSQHKYLWSAGRFAHSDECDHAIRMAKAPTPDELESARKFYGGA